MGSIGLIQTKVSNDLDENLKSTARLVRQAARSGAKIVCLPELFANPYFAQLENARSFRLAETASGPTAAFLAECAARNHVTLVGGSIFEKGRGKYYNTTLIFDPDGKRIGKYRKIHIPQDPHYHEQYYFTPGDLGYVQVRAGGAVIAPLICYDQWYPEAARISALRGAQIIFYPTAIGWFPELKKEEPFSARRWEHAMRAHASMNGIFVVAVNRVGREGRIRFWGGSFIADPFGEVVARASHSKEEALVAEIDLEKVRISQQGWRFFENRRPKTYQDIVR